MEIPRFPHNTEQHTLREAAIFYSPDDVSAPTKLTELGYPDQNLFLLHKEHPQLKITMQTVPANRYVEEPYQDISTIIELDQGVCCRSLWKMIETDILFTSWMELGNHGYSHSPPGDSELDHHEFSATQVGCNINHHQADNLSYCNQRFQLARQAYQQIGLNNDRIVVMRFPGFAKTDAALRALLDNGFVAYFGGEACGRENWNKLSDGREILEIPSISLYDFYRGQRETSFIDSCIQQGGVINFFDHWWDMFQAEPESHTLHYTTASTILTYIEEKYGTKAWWPFGSELALWFYFQRQAKIDWKMTQGHFLIYTDVSGWNTNWRQIVASYSVTLPGNFHVNRIIYMSRSGSWQELNFSQYWQDGDKIYFNVPFDGTITVDISLEMVHQ